MPAFSLAEALITLLIVCLITLASIPVLTKKKRSATQGPHGKYYCTLNSTSDYVEFYSQSPHGDINNPDTWSLVKSTKEQDTVSYIGEDGQVRTKVRNKCVFIAPLNARNFNVTVIGGGGGGHDGSVEYKEIFKKDTAGSGTFLANSDYSDYYDLILIAGGGGGGGSPRDWNNGHAGVGGGGASGAVVKIANLYLQKNATYQYTVGAGGAGLHGSMHGCCRPNNTDHARSMSGAYSSFKGNVNGNNLNISVPSGVGGDCIGCSKKKCRGGGAGWGLGNITVSGTNTQAVVAKQGGIGGYNGYQYCNKSGGPQGCGKLKAVSGGINIIKSFKLNSSNNYTNVSYGSGGDGQGHGSQGYAGLDGQDGALIISQSQKLYGEGGHAGKVVSRFIPSLEGYIFAEIPAAANSNEDGKQVRTIIKNNKTGNGIFVIAEGGNKGSTNKIASTDGENSSWTYKGSGKQGTACSSVRYMPGHYDKRKEKKLVCNKVKCSLDKFNGTYLQANNKDVGAVSASYPAGAKAWNNDEEESFIDEFYVDTLSINSNLSAIKTYLKTLNIFYLNDSNIEGKIVADIPDTDSALLPYFNKTEYDNVGCFYDKDKLEYVKVCADDTDVYKEYDVSVWIDAGNNQTCPSAEDGSSFGAGGGGGRAGDLQGVFGKGGKGAPGAVIIEW